MKLSKIVEVFPSVQALSATKLPAKASYRVAKALIALTAEVKLYEEQRIKLAEEFGTKSEDGKQFIFSDEDAPKFSEQMVALLDEECAVTLQTISPDDLGDVGIEAYHLATLDGILIAEPVGA